MRKALVFLVVFIILLLAPLGLRYVQFYRLGGGAVESPPVYDPVRVSQVSAVPTPATTAFVDDPAVGEGYVLLDRAHANEFSLDEIGYLDGRLAARGFELLHFEGGDLARALRAVASYVVITPLKAFTPAEVQAVADFVDRGGRLLLVGDPTRFAVSFEETDFSFEVFIESDKLPLNSLANEFNIVFNGDYLYNMVENEGNFRNIILQAGSFAEDPLTEGLDKIALYSAHSLQIGNGGTALLWADDDTWSSATDRPGGLVVGASSRQGNVLALGDVHLFIEPYHTVFDNGRFIAQIADFLTKGNARGFVLSDFPYFYRQPIDLVYTGTPHLGPDAFDEIIALQEAFRRAGKDLQLAAAPQDDHDVLYLGLFNQADEVLDLLASEGISLTITPPILTAVALQAQENSPGEGAEAEEGTDTPHKEGEEPAPTDKEQEERADLLRLIQSDLGKVQMSGTALIFLHQIDRQRSMVVLASSADGLENTVHRLLDLIPLNTDYALADCLMRDNLALCPTDLINEEVEAELLSGGEPDAMTDQENGAEEETPPEDAEDNDAEETGGGFIEGEPTAQGTIGLDETVEGALALDESHAWTFSAGPAVIDVVMVSDLLDGVLELYDPNDELLEFADNGFTGDGEELLNVDIPDDGEYTIVVRDYYGDEGEYALTVTAVTTTTFPNDNEPATTNGLENIFILVDDDGDPLDGGYPSGQILTNLLSSQYAVTLWTTSIDGPLQANTLEGTDLLIWDTADYLDQEGYLDPDTEIIFNYIDTNQGSLLMIGSAPILFSFLDLYTLADLEVMGDDSLLPNSYSEGDVITLMQPFQTIASEFLNEDLGQEDILLFNRGPASELPGTVAAIATTEGLNDGQRLAVLLFPFVALPQDVQEALLPNLLAWFGE